MFKELFTESRDTSVTPEWRIAKGKIERFLGKTPKKEDLEDIASTVGTEDLKLSNKKLEQFVKWIETQIE